MEGLGRIQVRDLAEAVLAGLERVAADQDAQRDPVGCRQESSFEAPPDPADLRFALLGCRRSPGAERLGGELVDLRGDDGDRVPVSIEHRVAELQVLPSGGLERGEIDRPEQEPLRRDDPLPRVPGDVVDRVEERDAERRGPVAELEVGPGRAELLPELPQALHGIGRETITRQDLPEE